MKTSIRDLVRRQRWNTNVVALGRMVVWYEAKLQPAPPEGWEKVIEGAWERYIDSLPWVSRVSNAAR